MNTVKTLALAALLLPSAALAQARPRYELGVDAAIAYTMPDNDDNALTIGVPFGVRVGILNPGPMNFEPRFTFNHASQGGGSITNFTPTVNVLYQVDKRAIVQRGLYFTAGLGLNITRVSFEDVAGEDFSDTVTDPTINFGIGARSGINQGAFRPEGYFAYGFDSESVQIGARLGLSFWK